MKHFDLYDFKILVQMMARLESQMSDVEKYVIRRLVEVAAEAHDKDYVALKVEAENDLESKNSSAPQSS